MLFGCGGGKSQFFGVQFCAEDGRGLEELRGELRHIATDEDMEFSDISQRVAGEHERIRQRSPPTRQSHDRDGGSPYFVVTLEHPDGTFVTATNLGLPGYEVALGFLRGRDPMASAALAERISSRLEKRWPLRRLAEGVGAMPMGGCE
jgi:hypothetical protein